MNTLPMSVRWPAQFFRAVLLVFIVCVLVGATRNPLLPPTNGPRRLDPTSRDGLGAGLHAIRGATIHPKPGEVIEKGTLLIRDGVIEAVRAEVVADGELKGYEVHECEGLHLYAGFIDAFVEVDAPRPDQNAPGAHWNALVTPQRSVLDGSAGGAGRAFGNPPIDDGTAEALRGMGFVAAGLSPRGGIFRGAAAAVSLGKPSGDASAPPVPVYLDRAYQTVGFDQARGGDGRSDEDRWGNYPGSQMGAIALIRQTMFDAKWQTQAVKDGRSASRESCLEALWPDVGGEPAAVRAVTGPGSNPVLWFDAGDELEALRADVLAKEFDRAAVLVGSGREFRRLGAIKASGRSLVVPLNFAERPRVTTVGEAESVDLERMMMWEQSPTNPRRLAAAGVEFALTTSKVPDKLGGRAGFSEKLRSAVKHGLTADQALAALTVTPAKLLGVEARLGTLEPGKVASVVVSDKPLFMDRPDFGKEDKKSGGDAAGSEAKKAKDAKPADAPESESAKEEKAKAEAREKARQKPAKILEVWIDGRRHVISPRPELDLAGTWEIRFIQPRLAEGEEPVASAATPRFRAEMVIDDQTPPGITIRKVMPVEGAPAETAAPADPAKAAEEASAAGNSSAPAKPAETVVTSTAREVRLDGNRLSFLFDHTPLGEPGVFRNSAVIERAKGADGQEDLVMHADVERAGGGKSMFTARRIKALERGEGVGSKDTNSTDAGMGTGASGATAQPGSEAEEIAAIPEALPLPFSAHGRIAAKAGETSLPAQENLAIINTTVWTCNAKNEVIEGGAVVISGGKITYVGPGASIPTLGSDYRVLDLHGGSHLTPGIIDAHSHTGISKGVNEAGQAVTSEVRIGDVTDPDSISWYRQLAGGTTCVNSMHGSANPIGGQTQTNKVRWGVEHPNQMHLEGAKPGIKFALGENVKQSNWGPRNTTRYPQTRMGVETLIRDRFQAAREYATQGQASGAMRRDLELEALAEILRGERLIHCHSYRQDEILMLCRVADEFGFKLGTFQHGLECYKVADEVKSHAIGASIFTDWWAYKVEVQDAIPQAGAILHDQGVNLSFNSDSDELARRMNYEAAKGIKYSGGQAGGQPSGEGSGRSTEVPRIDAATALRFVTINPAVQLGIGDRVGSLEVGKDADLVVWTVAPLSTYTRVAETYVDGRRMFSIEEDVALRGRIATERTRLIQKILAQEAREKGSPLMQPKKEQIKGEGEKPASRRSLLDQMRNQAADLRREQNLELLRRGLDPRFSRCADCGESLMGQ